MSSNNAKRELFVSAATKWAVETWSKIWVRSQRMICKVIADSAGVKFPHWITRDKNSPLKVGRGLWMVPVDGSPAIKAVADSSVGVDKAPEPVKEPVIITNKPTAPTSIVEMTKGTTSTVTNIPSKDPLVRSFRKLFRCQFDFQIEYVLSHLRNGFVW